MQLKSTLTKLLLILIIVSFVAGGYVYGLTQPVSTGTSEPELFIVKQGMAASEIAVALHSKGLIKSAPLFRALVLAQGLDNSLQAGEYAFTKNMKPQQIITMLAKGEVAYRQFTIPEGFTIEQIAKLLEDKKFVSGAKFKEAARKYAPYDFMAGSENISYNAEGFLFPDTYRVSRGISEEELLRMLVDQFNVKLSPEMRSRAAERGLSVREVIILASLVEKEAQVEKDRPVIAGVFLNRIKKSMPLQSCATIQYILGYPKAELTIQDTEIPSPYNTYQNPSLPPGPIANPGIASINAVLYPAETEYLYFVADKNGNHHFSKTYEEHLAEIDKVSR